MKYTVASVWNTEEADDINRNARPKNNQLITYYQRVSYLLRILQYLVNNTYNNVKSQVTNGAVKIRIQYLNSHLGTGLF